MKRTSKSLKNLLIAGMVFCLTAVPTIQSLATEAEVPGAQMTEGSSTEESSSVEESSTEESSSVEESSAEESSSVEESSAEESISAEEDSTDEKSSSEEIKSEESVDVYEEEPGEAVTVPTISYRTHVQTYGWQNFVSNGAVSGTTGQSKRLEGIEIKVGDTELNGDIEYQTHVQSYGWQDWVKNGAMSGTSGQSKRLEAIRIRLTGELEKTFDVYYSVHVQSIGWLDWAKNGEISGTSGLSRRLEGIKIVLVKKGEAAPGATERTFATRPTVTYRTHMQTYGWQDWSSNGMTSGVMGKSRRMEGLEAYISSDCNLSGSLQYRTHCQTYGWKEWVSDGQLSGTVGESKRVEALEMRLTGELANVCDVYYRVHVQGYGWLGWAKNGESAGTEGLGLRIEAVEIVLGTKAAPLPSGDSMRQYTGPGYYKIGDTVWYYSGVATRSTGTGWIRENGERYYFVNGEKVTGWQYIDGYKYYFYSDGRLCQNVDNIIGPQSSYVLKLNKQMNCLTVYAADGANGYIIPVKAMLTSTGDDTPLGTFYTPVKYRWRAMINGTYAQYATRLTAGQGFLFHSITYERPDIHTLIAGGYNMLGITKSLGCIRLVCGEAYWIYSRCALGTKVIVYNSDVVGPFDRPVVTPIPDNQRWDPTDPLI